jgi:hypothetical protein
MSTAVYAPPAPLPETTPARSVAHAPGTHLQVALRPPAAPERPPRTPREPLDQRLPKMARAFSMLFCEIEAGVRPRRHLQRLMGASLFARLSEVWVRPATDVAQVLTVHGTRTAPGIYDVVALLDRGKRVTALAFCIRRTSAGWRVVEVIRPEEGPLPDPPYPLPQDEPDVFDLVGA